MRGVLLLPQFAWKSISFIKTFYIDTNSFNSHITHYSDFVRIIGCANAKELAQITVFADEFSLQLENINKENSTFYDLYQAGIIKCCSKIADGLEVKRRYQNAVDLFKKLLIQKKYSNNYRGHWYSRLVLIFWRRLKKTDQV